LLYLNPDLPTDVGGSVTNH